MWQISQVFQQKSEMLKFLFPRSADHIHEGTKLKHVSWGMVQREGEFSFKRNIQVPIPRTYVNWTDSPSCASSRNTTSRQAKIVYNRKGRLETDNMAAMFQYGTAKCGQYWPGIIVAAFTHTVIDRIGQFGHCDQYPLLWVLWFDNAVEPSNWTTQPVNCDGGPLFQHTLMQHYLLHKHEVPSMPLMASHEALRSIEPMALMQCGCASYPCFDDVCFSANDRDMLPNLKWRFIVPPEFTGLGSRE